MIDFTQAICAEIEERWPTVDVNCRSRILAFPIRDTYIIDIFCDSFIAIATICIDGEKISIRLIKGQVYYENILSNPSSLDEVFKILKEVILHGSAQLLVYSRRHKVA
jgi:hypothetical protein